MAYTLVQKKAFLFSTIPFALLLGFSSRSVKGTARPFSKRGRKGQLWYLINTSHHGRKLTKSQKEPSGLPVLCHFRRYSKCFIPLTECNYVLETKKNNPPDVAFEVRL